MAVHGGHARGESRRGKFASLRGEISVPADKSLCHRAILFAAIADGVSEIVASDPGRDNLQTMRVVRELGVRVDAFLSPRVQELARDEGIEFEPWQEPFCKFVVHGKGLGGLSAPQNALYCGNSGTTARLLTGVLATQPFAATLTGDSSLSRRPFRRVAEPLGQMGASFSDEKLPLTIQGGTLRGIDYFSPKASAQVKSAILLAGLGTTEQVTVKEPWRSRDHTERMLLAMGCALEITETSVTLPARIERRELRPLVGEVPGDLSAAAFFLVAASVTPASEVTIRGVGINRTRTGILDILERMGAVIERANVRTVGGEEVCDLRVRSASLHGTVVTPEEVVLAIDEIPALAVAAAFAVGKTEIRGAEELRVKESDRLAMVAMLLKDYGFSVEELPDGLIIEGGRREVCAPPVRPAPWEQCGDHRISMCGAILEGVCSGEFALFDRAAVETSFPTFLECFEQLGGEIQQGSEILSVEDT